MAKKYKQFSKKQFEWELRAMRLGRVTDITEELLNEGKDIWERVYSVSTRNKSVDVIVFSSVDMRTSHVRDHGADMVRIVLRWKTKRGNVYKKVQHRERIETLFKNLRASIETAQSEVFNLNFKEFYKEVV